MKLELRRAEILRPKAKANQAHGLTVPGKTLCQNSDKALSPPVDTLATAAEAAHVSRDTAAKVRAIEASGNDDVKAKAATGEVRMYSAL